jgi:hypothetical protein
MGQDSQSDVFLSHSAKDKAVVRTIFACALEPLAASNQTLLRIARPGAATAAPSQSI